MAQRQRLPLDSADFQRSLPGPWVPLNSSDSLAGSQRPRHRLAVRRDEPWLGSSPSHESLQNVMLAHRFVCRTSLCASNQPLCICCLPPRNWYLKELTVVLISRQAAGLELLVGAALPAAGHRHYLA